MSNKPLLVIMKPTLGCNLRCRHCYHRPEECSDLVMSPEILERTIRLVREGYDSTHYFWHGGEPLLAGEHFYKRAFNLQRRYYGKAITRCGNTIQTNGTLLKNRFIEFCRDNRVNIGVSYEGGYGAGLRPGTDVKALGDTMRYMVRKGHMFSVSATVHGGNVDSMMDMYESFREQRIPFNFSPSLRIGCGLDNQDTYLDRDTFIRNSIEVFDRWLTDADTPIPVLPYFQYVRTSLDAPNISDCAHSSCLMKWICVYPNGDVYPCGKACPEKYRMGNIAEVDSIEQLFKGDGFRNILKDSVERRNKCKSCPIYAKCMGGCTVDAFYDGDARSPGGFSCETYKAIYGHIDDALKDIMDNQRDLSAYNRYVRDSIVGKLTNPNIITPM